MPRATVTAQGTEFLEQFLRELTSAAFGWALVFSFAAFVAALVIAIVLARRGSLRREATVWNALAKLAYPALLVGVTLLGAAAGAVYGAQRHTQEALRVVVRPMITANMPAYRAYVDEALGGYVPDQRVTVRELIEPYIKVYQYVPASNSAWERTKARVINEFMLRYAADVFIERFQAVLGARIESLGAKLDLSVGDGTVRFTARQVVDFFSGRLPGVDWAQLDTTLPDMIVAALGAKMNQYCRSIYFSIGLSLVLLLLPLAVEMGVYSRYRRRARPAAAL